MEKWYKQIGKVFPLIFTEYDQLKREWEHRNRKKILLHTFDTSNDGLSQNGTKIRYF
jgi:hypothetical protein